MPFMLATASKVEIEQFTLKKGDLIITKDSEDPSDIGIPALVVEDAPGVVCGYHLTLIRSVELATARLLHRVLQSTPTHAYFYIESPGITRYGLGQDVIGDLRVCMPPENEIVRIADCIDRETKRIDSLITKKTRFIELLKEKRQALITHAVTKGLDPNVKMRDSGVEWIGDVPESWDDSKIKYVIDSMEQGWSPQCESIAAAEHEWGVLKVGCVNGGIFNPKENKLLPEDLIPDPTLGLVAGDVIVSRANTRELVGGCAVIHSDYPKLLLCDKLYRLRPNEKVLSEFLARVIQVYGRPEIETDASGTSASMVNISMSTIRDLRFYLPAIETQREILSRITRLTGRLDLITAKTQHSIDLLKERRSAFITAAVTGQIDLREPA
jgi:type I restriction enzyme S subunit